METYINVIIPEGIDLDHTLEAVLDALDFSENVTEQEYKLIESILRQLVK